MNFVISFFRDTISGFWYFIYIILCIFFIFVLLGIVGDRKRAVIAKKLKEKKAQDIASGKEARIAAMESKQILDVMSDDSASVNGTSNLNNSNVESSKEDKAPAVLVIDETGKNTSSENNTYNNLENIQNNDLNKSNDNIATVNDIDNKSDNNEKKV